MNVNTRVWTFPVHTIAQPMIAKMIHGARAASSSSSFVMLAFHRTCIARIDPSAVL